MRIGRWSKNSLSRGSLARTCLYSSLPLLSALMFHFCFSKSYSRSIHMPRIFSRSGPLHFSKQKILFPIIFCFPINVGLSVSSTESSCLSGFVFPSDSELKPSFLGERDIRLIISTNGSDKDPRLSFDEEVSGGCGSALVSDLLPI